MPRKALQEASVGLGQLCSTPLLWIGSYRFVASRGVPGKCRTRGKGICSSYLFKLEGARNEKNYLYIRRVYCHGSACFNASTNTKRPCRKQKAHGCAEQLLQPADDKGGNARTNCLADFYSRQLLNERAICLGKLDRTNLFA